MAVAHARTLQAQVKLCLHRRSSALLLSEAFSALLRFAGERAARRTSRTLVRQAWQQFVVRIVVATFKRGRCAFLRLVLAERHRIRLRMRWRAWERSAVGGTHRGKFLAETPAVVTANGQMDAADFGFARTDDAFVLSSMTLVEASVDVALVLALQVWRTCSWCRRLCQAWARTDGGSDVDE